MKRIGLSAAALAVLGIAACDAPLDVKNLSSPDVARVFALPTTIEQTIGTGYQLCHNATTNTSLLPQLQTMSLESYSQLGNFSMGIRSAIPRGPIQNNRTSASIFPEFSDLSKGARTISNAITALDQLVKDKKSFANVAQTQRARAFGFFVIGCDLGWASLLYDSAAVVGPGMPSDSIPPLSASRAVNAAALAMLDSAIAIANASPASSSVGFPLPATWLGGTGFSRDNFVRLVRSFKARFRAGYARTPAERSALDWALIVADAENGITADFLVNTGGSTGWNIGFNGSQMHVDATWHQITPMIFGMADVSGEFDRWLAQPLASRFVFLIQTPDKRFPAGATRAAQQAAFAEPTSYTSHPYIRNRTSDSPGEAWGTSYYSHVRTKYIRNASNTGNYPEMMKTEIDMLAAEGYIRQGNFAAAAARIDLSRVASGGLPALTGVVTNGTLPVPGGASCVPRVPQAPAFASTACGNLWEAMKWEKRMETAFTSFGMWYWDARGWGDLPAGTPLEYPVPYQEMDARQKPFYDLGGGGPSSAVRGTYGF